MNDAPDPLRDDVDPISKRVETWRRQLGPVGRYPYLSAFILFSGLMTVSRSCLRHIPDPPPKLGSMPSWQAAEFSSQALAGQVYLLGLRCDNLARCPDLSDVSGRLQVGFDREGIRIPTVLVSSVPADSATLPRPVPALHRVTVPPGELARLTAALGPLAPPAEGSADTPSDRVGRRLWLVDRSGTLRGVYDVTTEAGGDEAFHRARYAYGEGGAAAVSGCAR